MFKDKEQEVHVGFNKLTGSHMTQVSGMSEDKLDTQYFKWKTVFINPNTHRWVGDYDDGKVMAIGELKPATDEIQLNELCEKKIIKDGVTIHGQLNAFAEMFEALITKGFLEEDDPGVQEFQRQKEIIDRARKNNALYKEVRKNSPEEHYLTKEQLDQKKNAQMAGGLNVLIGRY